MEVFHLIPGVGPSGKRHPGYGHLFSLGPHLEWAGGTGGLKVGGGGPIVGARG